MKTLGQNLSERLLIIPPRPPSPPFCDFQAQCYRFCFFRCQVAVVGVVRHVCVCMHAETGAGR